MGRLSRLGLPKAFPEPVCLLFVVPGFEEKIQGCSGALQFLFVVVEVAFQAFGNLVRRPVRAAVQTPERPFRVENIERLYESSLSISRILLLHYGLDHSKEVLVDGPQPAAYRFAVEVPNPQVGMSIHQIC
jgi:hypothetical protein